MTKLSHIHFPANEDARERIIKLGENPDLVFNVGCPRIDLVKEFLEQHRNGERIDQDDFFNTNKGVGARFDLEEDSFLLVLHHPVTTEFGLNRKNINETLLALNEFQMPTIMIWPNADAGSQEMAKAIRTFVGHYKPNWLHLFINLPVMIFVKLMDLCACMVGNSSSAIREGAFIGVPAVNIGTRQSNRIRGKNVIDVDNSKQEIFSAIKKQIGNGQYEPEAIYGDGNSGVRIADILANLQSVSVQKRILY
jgi:UDP-hydrolysing UDP-N-acetyl-D-glucosamine 2-epimerase